MRRADPKIGALSTITNPKANQSWGDAVFAWLHGPQDSAIPLPGGELKLLPPHRSPGLHIRGPLRGPSHRVL
ncbi:hypothetical protein NF556_00485 [Ornithinimicrobium faecis]|uniref:Uncharacterized protein n=1 Tax=Ornithinimicrobium faecis TaxID=2934158 RepID=A0ABY4YTW9_9MICO|nr:hypothetical protein [Ornithinimicrobium sp. HY1793]USQ80174.1 hypothetical protein NF556_00485 [Ornithinimicrobium sp. HY1793]